jgi:hypothetical protein
VSVDIPACYGLEALEIHLDRGRACRRKMLRTE